MTTLDDRVAELERQWDNHVLNHDADRVVFDHEVRDRFSTLNSPVWKRLLFRIDGWGPWHIVRTEQGPKWRPWRRWWTS